MRFFVLVFNLLLGLSLLTQSAETWAASANTTRHKNKHSAGHNASSAKIKHALKQKSSTAPSDVWVRLRSGMQIPRPLTVVTDTNTAELSTANPLQLQTPLSPEQQVAVTLKSRYKTVLLRSGTKITPPKTAITPHSNYTTYGRLKLNSSIASRIRQGVALEKQLANENNNPATVASQKTRLYTRIEALARLNQSRIQTVAETPPRLTTNPIDLTKANTRAENVQPALDVAKLAALNAPYDRVNKHIVWHTQHRDYVYQVAERARPYLFHIVESLSAYKLPYELALLPIVESAYQATAQSPKSAAGLWQFIPSTGLEFDLQQNDQYDARLDITASTRAAMRYLSFLKQHFKGDWLLALAAYNCGLGTVDNAMSRNKAEGLDTDYWSLHLPEETQEYVPRFLALASLFADPDNYGLKLKPISNEPYFVKVKIDRKLDTNYLAEKDLTEIAQLSNLSHEQFTRLNPGFVTNKLAAEGPFNFLLPEANAQHLHRQLTRIAEFMTEPKLLATKHAPLKTIALADSQKSALFLLDELNQARKAELVNENTPFLSFELNTPNTTPRLLNQSSLAPVRIKNNS